MILAIYGLAIFVGSFLLFLIQPMVGKILLPALGGAPAVWTTCMLFFQAALLAGYLYAEKSIKKLGCEKQSVIHLLLMALGLLSLPLDIEFNGLDQAAITPVSWLFARLTGSIGFLFFIIAANAPLIQRWYSQTGQKDSEDPYFLYSASNAGSLLALLVYPFLFEPAFTLTTHKHIWSGLYLIQMLLVFLAAMYLWQGKDKKNSAIIQEEKLQNSFLSWKTRYIWVLWGFIPCSAMLGVTTHIATDIASGPMLWIFPLAIYLISFILVFAATPRFREIAWDRQMLPMAALISIMYFFKLNERAWFVIPLHLYFLFTVCMAFHGRLAINRPAPALLNSYYVWMSVGGILGGFFNGIVAPTFFNTQIEYLLTVIIAVLASTFSYAGNNDEDFPVAGEFLVFALIMLVLMTFAWFSEMSANTLMSLLGFVGTIAVMIVVHLFYRFRKAAGILFLIGNLLSMQHLHGNSRIVKIDRSFFGIHKITRLQTDGTTCDPDLKIAGVADIFYCLSHGTTLHGVERKVDIRPLLPLSYYSREGPIGDVFRLGLLNRQAKNVGIVGLGCGTLAWYGRPWQNFDFYEIDPMVVNIASNPEYFTYLSRSKAKTRIIVGDARVKLRQAKPQQYDLLVLDAYSSDSVPVHLLTLEAFKLYLSKLKPHGILVLHISNRYFKLSPVISRIFAQLDMHSLERFDDPKNYSIKYDWYDEKQISKSFWVAGSKNKERLEMLKIFGDWQPMKISDAYSIWTDDYANLLQVYNWR
ncbi:MAG: fused MFS/spermidine synthase [Candidatus Riflebacteria bacterium]